jgi:hypothetical protein
MIAAMIAAMHIGRACRQTGRTTPAEVTARAEGSKRALGLAAAYSFGSSPGLSRLKTPLSSS